MQSRIRPLPDWQRAFGSPVFQGLIKRSASDFQVTEVLGFSPSDSGEHDFLWIEKQGANTTWVANTLAAHAGVVDRDVGYAGMKDRHAVTRQWFSVRRPDGSGTPWQHYAQPGVEILDVRRNQRKLKRGAHRGNAFRMAIEMTTVGVSRQAIEDRLGRIRTGGVPNYFGEQRFGRAAANLQLAASVFAGKKLKRDKRSIALSAARAFLFNEILHARIADGNWSRALPGEMLNLDSTGSVFPVEVIDDEIQTRLDRLDIHPTGALWGRGRSAAADEAAVYDHNAAAAFPELAAGLEKAGMSQARRALRLNVHDLTWEFDDNVLWLDFELTSGAFATSVIRELCTVNQQF